MKTESAETFRNRIVVKNFGPIESASVDIRPLTVFLGPSNTGKSYLAMLIHALSRYFSWQGMSIHGYISDMEWRNQIAPVLRPRHVERPHLSSKKELKAFEQWLNKDVFSIRRRVQSVPMPPEGLAKCIRTSLQRSFGNTENLDYLLRECFGFKENKDFIRYRSRGGSKVSMMSLGSNSKTIAEMCLAVSAKDVSLEANISPGLDLSPTIADFERFRSYGSRMFRRLGNKRQSNDFREFVLTDLYSEFCSIVPSPFFELEHRSHYLPADRTGIMHAHQVVASSLVHSATYGGIGPSVRTPAMSGVLGEFLLNLIEDQRMNTQFGRFAKKLENELLLGEIKERRAQGTNYPSFFYRPKGWNGGREIPLMSTSSMVSELAPIILYLRHVVRRKQLLIIEEPESHLHPAAQAEFAVYLAKLVNGGLKVLVTTHSEWLLEQFSNLVQLSGIEPQHRERIEEHHSAIKGAALEADKVGVWAFESPSGRGGSTVQEVELADDQGGMPEQYEEVMRQLYNEWQAVRRHLENEAELQA